MQDPEKPHKAENRLDQQTDHRFFHRHDHKKSGDVNQNTAVVVGQPGHQITSESAPKTKNGGYGYYVKLWTYATPVDVILRLCGFLAACGAGAVFPLMTIVFGRLVNDFNDWGRGATSPEQMQSAVNRNALWFVYLFIAKFCLVYIHTTTFTITAVRTTRTLRREYIRSILRQDIAYFDTCTPGSVASNISNNADMIQTGLSEKVGVIIQGLSMLVSAFIVAFAKGWKLTLVTATTLPAAVIAVGITIALDARLEAKILDIYAKAGGLAEEALSSIRVVAAFGAQNKLLRKYDAYLEVAKTYGVKKGPILGTQYSAEFFMMYCAYALAFWYGIRLLLRGEIDSGGTVTTILFSVVIGTSSLTMIAPSLGEVTKAAAAAKAVLDMIAKKSTIDPVGAGGVKPDAISGQIAFRGVFFAYPARPTLKVLEDLTLDFEARKVTAIVGASGSGKSTIVCLTERWYDPTEGQILLDGNDIKDLNVRWLRSQIGLVQQEPVLFNDTIYNNVVHGLFGTEMDNLPEQDKRRLVQDACIEANADGFIQGLPEGYDTKVGERAGFISGGQKQRIAIARSIISNPRILLLDEATSALDPKAEEVVQDALDKVSKTRTTVMIAHKLSTVKKADKIIVMNQGRVIEHGTHESLLESKGAYSRLVNAQKLSASEDDSEGLRLGKSEDGDPKDLDLAKVQTTRSTRNVESELKPEDVSRRLSLFRCLLIIFYEHRRLWRALLAGCIASVAGGAVFPAQAVLFSRVVTVFQLPESQWQERGNFWALMFFVLALGTLISYASLGFFFTIAAFVITRFYRSEYFGAMLRQDISFYDLEGHSSGALTSRLSTDPQRLQDLVSANIGLILIVIVNLLSCCTLALVVGWKLALVAIFGCLPPLFFAGFVRMKLEMNSQDRTAAMYEDSTRFASEAVGAIRTVSSLTLESKVLDTYGKGLDHTVRKAYKHTFVSMILFGLSESLDLFAMGLAFWYGGKLLFQGEYNATDFFVIFVAIIFGGQAAGFLFGFTLNTTKAHAAANHILYLRKQQPPINSSTGMQIPSTATGIAIEFKNVRFAYPTRPDITVLRGLNLKIHHGQTIGIVGASGCGKTTVITLLERFYDINSGEILVHGQTLSSLDVKAYRSTVGLVSQDTTLYQGSLRENILLGLPDDDASEEKLIQACKAANIHTFITSLPEGYSTEAGSRGIALSGGQRQRIAIARALVCDPTILLLDEATSALDTQSEAVVQEALETASKGRTTVAVAHRLSTIRDADCIFVLDAGKVVEAGTHAELVRRKGKYWDMVQAQSLDREAK